MTSNSSHKIHCSIKLCEQLASHGSELTRAPRMSLIGVERANVERIYNEAVANRIDLSKFNLD
ncbi:hypothetical protein [Colwellia sp. 12G3]|uniref:hypothetical protein n=1 Tax=Colwellia sp. 12G3 TaxID=2058299 RepID=UPI0018E386EF|nr:hypothetical protein [Colwellia sp. 12G3]